MACLRAIGRVFSGPLVAFLPAAGHTQTFNYTGAGLTPHPENPADCPDVTSITGTATVNGLLSGKLTAGPISAPIFGGSSGIAFDASGRAVAWTVIAFKLEGATFIVTSKKGIFGTADNAQALFVTDPNTPAFQCAYGSATVGTWTPALAAANNLGGSRALFNLADWSSPVNPYTPENSGLQLSRHAASNS